ncbi:DUF4178 domain-containing protein [Pendulispora albinea]|uniref:DUF4178 domain-containing protein n=1 Tax=Pendulispora albinea TaxID=2741071 RepID=A0ABZ2LKY5_9BACT
MTFQVRLVRSGPCPQCGAPVEFASGTAPAQICKHCRFVVVRTDRDFRSMGRVADLVPMATPFGLEARGTLEGRPFRVAGRVQYDRIQAPGAPWEEIYLEMDGGAWAWLAHAQGRWLLTSLYGGPPLPMRPPSFAEANPGVVFPVPNMPGLAVVERGQRRFVSGEGELPFPMVPSQVEAYADLAGQGGTFATIDYDAQGWPAHVYFGRAIDPRALAITSAAPLAEAPRAQVTTLVCPKCGGNLPLVAPDQAERIACRYCGMLCDVRQGALVALRELPLPEQPPAIPLGTKGTLRGQEVTLLGYMVRATVVDGETYSWREYLFYASTPPPAGAPPAASSFVFLLEEDGDWQYIVPIHAGEVQRSGPDSVALRGQNYRHLQTVQAVVTSVLGEFYWQVELGETVTATEYEGPHRQKVSQESTRDEVQFSHSSVILGHELRAAFPSAFTAPRETSARAANSKANVFFLVLFALWFVVTMAGCLMARDTVVLEKSVPVVVKKGNFLADAPKAEPWFSEPFVIPGGHNMEMEIEVHSACMVADDAWVTADIALVHMDSGEVWEDSVDFSDNEKSIWYSRLPDGQYVLRVEPDSNKVGVMCGPLKFRLVSGARPFGYMWASFGVLFVIWLFSRRTT